MNAFNKLNFLAENGSLPIYYQSELADCGAACLAMVAAYHGSNLNVKDVVDLIGGYGNGLSLKDLSQAANRIGFDSRAISLEMDELNQLVLPCVLHWDFNHYVVLKKVKGDSVTIHDPAEGRKKLTLEDVSKHFTGIALELSQRVNLTNSDRKRTRLGDFFSGLSGLGKILSKVALLTVALQILTLVSPLFIQFVIDDVIAVNDLYSLNVLGLSFTLVLLCTLFVGYVRRELILYLSAQLNLQMISNLFRHLIHLPSEYFERRKVGDILSRFNSLTEVREFITTGVVSFALDGLLSLLTLALMFAYSSKLAFIVIGFVILHITIRAGFLNYLRRLTERNINAEAKEQSILIESIRGAQSVKLFGAENKRIETWQNTLVNSLNSATDVGKADIKFETFQKFVRGFEHIVIIFFAAVLVLDNKLTLGMMLAFVAYRLHFSESINNLISTFINFKLLNLHLDRISDITQTEKEDVGIECEREIDDVTLRAENLSFRYIKNSAPVIDQLSFKISSKECFGITGASGTGKTTLLKLILGLVKPNKGAIYINDQSISEFGLINFRKLIATVMQDDQLLSGSILENICFFDSHPDIERAIRCAKHAAIHDQIMEMPMAYQTLIGDMGSSLSGGQKQRVLIARALYKEPKILIMDEATAHLDKMTEKVINQNLSNLNIIRIIVAHRQETIDLCDRTLDLT